MQGFIDRLSRYSHRWSGSKKNIEAMEMLLETFKAFGFITKSEPFRVPGTMFSRLNLSILLLFAVNILLVDFYILSIILCSIILISLWGEFTFSFNLLGVLFTGHRSSNLSAQLNQSGREKKQVIVIAHHDSPKTGLLYKVADWMAPKQAQLPAPFNRMFVLPFMAALLWGLLIVIRPLNLPNWIIIILTAISISILLLLLFVLLNIILSQKSQGANDNGSGLIVLMELARRFSDKNVLGIPITLLSTGAEEVGLTGIKNYIKQHPELDKENTLFINLECLGGGELNWATGEHYFRKVNYPQQGVDIIQNMEKQNVIPVLPKTPLISPTDASPLANNGFNVITLIGLNDSVVPSNYHRVSDTFDRLDLSLLQKSADICEAVIYNYLSE